MAATEEPQSESMHEQLQKKRWAEMEGPRRDSATKTYRGFGRAAEQPPLDAWRYAVAGDVPVRRLVLKPKDEEHREDGAPTKPGFCVDELCTCARHWCEPTKPPPIFDGSTTYRDTYKGHPITKPPLGIKCGPDGVPIGVDPKAWKEYCKLHGVPAPDQIPSHLFYRAPPDNRDFATEYRVEYKYKGAQRPEGGMAFGPDGVPIGVDPKLWQEYIDKHGFPEGGVIPSYLFYRPAPENRDFSTNYRDNYVRHHIETCPVQRLPAYPNPAWPREHVFWDPVAKVWY